MPRCVWVSVGASWDPPASLENRQQSSHSLQLHHGSARQGDELQLWVKDENNTYFSVTDFTD